MKAITLVFTSVVLYAALNIITEQKLARFSTAALLIGIYSVMLPLSFLILALQKIQGVPLVFPTGVSVFFVLAVGIVFFFADFCYIGAYTIARGNAVTVTIVFTMLPVFVSAIKFVWTGSVPNRYHIAAYLCALAAAMLATKGQTVT